MVKKNHCIGGICMQENPVLYVVIPCYNEEEVLNETSSRLKDLLYKMIDRSEISNLSRVMFVDDGSKDKTWDIVEKIYESDNLFSGIKLTRNCGHQNALLAGLMTAKEFADCVISIDADLQDDIASISEFVKKFKSGCDVVYGVRKSRKTDTFFKRTTAELFYKFMRSMGVKILYNHADYRLLSKRALEKLSEYNEVNLFLRGIVPLIGYKSDIVYYDRHERFAGESKYPLKKMLAFAFDGITSFSVTPIRFVTASGFIISLLSLLALLYAVIGKYSGLTIPGWSSLILSIWFLGGFQLLAIGLIGEYVGKIYKEVKGRPKYFIETVIKK